MSAFRRKLHRNKKISFKSIFIAILLLIAFAYWFVVYPLFVIAKESKYLTKSAREIKEAFSQNDLGKVEVSLSNLKKRFSVLSENAKRLYWLRFIPLIGLYANDLKSGVEAGNSLIVAAEKAIIAIEPYSDLIGFKKGKSFVEKSAEERIQTAVLTLDKLSLNIDEIAPYVYMASDSLKKINPKRYPKKIGRKIIREKLEKYLTEIEAASDFFIKAKPLIKKLAPIMGSDREKIYLILFQNDKELRPTGGFITAYAIFRIKDGKLRIERSQDIYSLDAQIPDHPKAPREILMYHKGVTKFWIRDSNLSPDFPTSVSLFEKLYKKSKNYIEYDGIIAVDTKVLVDSLSILGDTEVRGTIFSSEKDSRCDCPQVIYKLLDEIDRPVATFREDRKGILGDLLFVLFKKALSSSPSIYWGRLSQMIFSNLNEKHILVYMKDASIQKAFSELNYAGEIKDYNGDYLHINNTNFAGAKSNLFVRKSVISKTNISKDGEVERELILEYKNPYPGSDCNLERGGLCINATLRNWLRIYVPKGSKLKYFKGSEKEIKIYDELDKTVFEGFITVQPLGKSVASVSYTIPKKFYSEKDYKLLVQKQPGTHGDKFTFFVNNKEISEKLLNEDFELIIK